jgi:Uma2 family endonuclease
MLTLTKPAPRPIHDPRQYPDSDGKPLGETPRHLRNIFSAFDILDRHYADDPEVYVASNMFIYFVEGDRRRHVSPDLFIVKGVPKRTAPERRSYRTWEESGRGPSTVIEYTSKSTRREDLGTKLELYRDVLRVKEYFLFDPYAEWMDPPLQGFRLRRGRYVRIRPVDGRLPSEELGLHLVADDDLLRFWQPSTGRFLATANEIAAERDAAAAKLEQLEAELKALKHRQQRRSSNGNPR